MPDEVRERGLYYTNPKNLLTAYADSHLGKWHNDQPPRYPNFHRDLPESVTPEDSSDSSSKDFDYQMTFGRAWLKNLALLGHIGAINQDNHMTVQDRFPYIDVSDVIGGHDTQASDLHPVGHMVRTSVMLHETLNVGKKSQFQLSPYGNYLTRSAMALHDIGENEHPGVLVETGSIVGDISAAAGKTADDRAQERKILESILSNEFADYFDDEMIEIMSHLIGHRTSQLDPEFVNAHSIQEIAHNLNSLRTGLFAANVAIWCAGTLARHGDDHTDGRFIIGHSMAMAEQHVKILSKKFNEVQEETPDVYAFYAEHQIDDAMSELQSKTHELDSNESYTSWRRSDAIVEHYGSRQ
ncbi:hypothetical protein A2707_01090 [Candidatus Saccharibacteria bacterium RIFCSPHIGHO2_01_FULL_45_15]|nr:MAG: hypothetical protein A2707_01090 [Candidatus Saccharibacteria bacterium RIFCSPHIGHO2_01_FULL_45_15]OGL26966.1 MAG: hypothetical protein A3C39_02205 [Candidatus Saccharibacteria bacterium RIFCSPHIGHO2_02_FULL_46_12]OGL32932.1 MAG: hypothetical protein A3E76_06240 [Candidatus Saccharibacteria bacterium RIFCSPHIGHO2_12_FULL_44_22]